MGAPRGALVSSPMPLQEPLITQPCSRELMQVSSSPDLPGLMYSSDDVSTDSDSSEEDIPERKDSRSNRPHRLSRKSVTRFEKDPMGFSDSDTDEGEFDDPQTEGQFPQVFQEST